MSDVTWAPNAGTALLLKVASGQVPVSLLKYAELHKQAIPLYKILKPLAGALKRPILYVPMATAIAPAAVKGVSDMVVEPVAESIGEGLNKAIDGPLINARNHVGAFADTFSENAERLGESAERAVAPLKRQVLETATGVGTSFGDALTRAAIPGATSMVGAGVGGLTGSVLASVLFKGNKDEAVRRRRMLTWLAAGIGGLGGLYAGSGLQSYIYPEEKDNKSSAKNTVSIPVDLT